MFRKDKAYQCRSQSENNGKVQAHGNNFPQSFQISFPPVLRGKNQNCSFNAAGKHLQEYLHLRTHEDSGDCGVPEDSDHKVVGKADQKRNKVLQHDWGCKRKKRMVKTFVVCNQSHGTTLRIQGYSSFKKWKMRSYVRKKPEGICGEACSPCSPTHSFRMLFS